MIERYNITQAAELLECDPDTVAERIVAGDLPGVKFGRGWIIPAQALTQRLNELALQQAEERRRQRNASQAAGTAIRTAKSPRRARTPPALPEIGRAQ